MEETEVFNNYLDVNTRKLLCEAMLIDITNYTPDELIRVFRFLQILVQNGASSIFTMECQILIKEHMVDLVVRRFVLNMHETTMMLRASFAGTSDSGEREADDWIKGYIGTIIAVRSAYTPDITKSVLETPTLHWLSIAKEGLMDLLTFNRWMVTLYLAIALGAVTKFVGDYKKFDPEFLTEKK